VDLRFYRGALPGDLTPSGALVGCLPTDPLARRLQELRCPSVRVGHLPHPDDHLFPAVLPDLTASGRLAAEHFAERGFRNVAYVGHDPWSDAHAFYEGFQARALELGCKSHLLRIKSAEISSLRKPAAKYERTARQVGDWLGGLPNPVGVLGYSDAMAAAICAMCSSVGLTVPEDIAVLGLGNDRLDCELAPVELSSIDTAQDEAGRQAVLLLQRLMDGESAPREPIMVPPNGVVERYSTDVLAVRDPMVGRAMRFMWDHLDLDLSVDRVAEEVAVPRRQLERAFRRNLDRGVNAELLRKRLERCRELLRTTNVSITDLAPTIGFRSKDYLHAVFRRTFGMTPRQYRLRCKGEH
jgi:LacI family transcriptional regulator